MKEKAGNKRRNIGEGRCGKYRDQEASLSLKEIHDLQWLE